jgi:HAE1 family hydrophobic/amphiphilic exporter-1
VRLPERFNSPEAFEEIVMRTYSDGSQVKIGDVATINLGVETYSMIPRVNKQTCAIIALYQAPGSNALNWLKISSLKWTFVEELSGKRQI